MKDFLLDTDSGDLAIANGDLVVNISDRQHQKLLIEIEKGELKEFPTAGVGATSFLEAESPAAFLREVRSQFIADGMNVGSIKFDGNLLRIDASYKDIIATPVNPRMVKTIAGQTWIDMALQEEGGEEKLFEMADNNGVGITDDLPPNSIVQTMQPDDDKLNIVKILQETHPSSLFIGTGNPAEEGIESWAIEYDFVVS